MDRDEAATLYFNLWLCRKQAVGLDLKYNAADEAYIKLRVLSIM